MECTGKINGISAEWGSGRPVLSLVINEASAIEKVAELKDCEKLSIKVTKWRDKRSLDANAYFHVLVDKLRQAIGISFPACKNHLITSYGQIEYIEGEQVIIKTNLPPSRMEENETIHCKPVKVEIQAKEVWYYRVYRGSHTYDSREMALLIDGAVAECRLQGIETMTPEQIREMEAKWQAKS